MSHESPSRPPTLTRFLRYAAGVWMAFFIVACQAPQSEPIQGDVASALKKGISQGKETFEHQVWDELLQQYAKEGGSKFDYTGLKSEEAKLDGYLERLAGVDLSSLSGNELLALFINAYNAYTVKTILDKVSPDGTYQVESIRDISDVFDLEDHVVGGFRLSLNNMEHNILRPLYKDPRIHFAVNCASASCPPLPVRAFDGDTVEDQLEETARSVLSSPDYIRVEDDHLVVTRIMDWYGSDFVTSDYKGAEEDLPAFIRKYTREEVRQWIDSQTASPGVKFMDYDWSLNRVM